MVTAENWTNVLEEQLEEISYSLDQEHGDGRWVRVGGTSRRPDEQMIGAPEGEKVIEDIFLALKKNLNLQIERVPNLHQD